MEALWQQLGGQDVKGAKAALALAEAGQPAVGFLRDKLLADDGRETEIKRLVVDLDNDTWKVRDEASRRLKELGPQACDLLRLALGETKSAEVKARITDILAGQTTVPACRLRAVKAIEVIEGIGGQDALDALRRLSQEKSPYQVRWYAREAYWRLAEKAVEGLLAEADRKARDGNFAAATAACSKAAGLAKSALPAEECIIQARLKRYAANQRADAQPKWLDLLDLADPARDTVSGTWQKNAVGLSGGKDNYERIKLPAAPDGDYHVRLKFTRQSGENDCTVLLPAGKGVARVSFCWPDTAPNLVGREKAFPADQAALPPGGWVSGVEYTADVIVRLDGAKATVQVLVNGNLAVDWTGWQEELTVYPAWEIADQKVPAVGASASPTIFSQVRLRMLSGKVKIVEQGK